MTALAVTAVCGMPAAEAGASGAAPAPPAVTSIEQIAGFRPAPEFLSLFAPRLHRDAYRSFVSALSLADVLRRLAADPLRLLPPGAWAPQATLPFDAFGEAGTYDRFRLARLYGARRAMVARGPRGRPGAVAESWTLVSPYPDAQLEHLEPGTLLIVLEVPER